MFFVCDLMLELDGKRVVALLAFITHEGLEYCVAQWEKRKKIERGGGGGLRWGKNGACVFRRGGGVTIGGDAIMVCICLLL